MKKFYCIFLLLIVSSILLAQPPNGKKVVGACVQWGRYGRDYQVKDNPGEKLSHNQYAFFEPRHDARKDVARLGSIESFADFEHTKKGKEWQYPTGKKYQLSIEIAESRDFTPLPEKVIVGYWHSWENASAPFMYLKDVDPKSNQVIQ